VYAVCGSGVFKSTDRGERELGGHWRNVGGEANEDGAVFAVDPRGDAAKLYMLASSGMYHKNENDVEWTAFPRGSRQGGFGDFEPVAGKPVWLRIDEKVEGRLFRGIEGGGGRFGGAGVNVSVSDDGGRTWSSIIRSTRALDDGARETRDNAPRSREALMELRALRQRLAIQDLRVDRRDSNVWYGLLTDGVAVTRDAGKNWTTSREGLDIPRVGAIWLPRHSDVVMAGTPAGMYVSRNGGKSWEDTSLVPIFEGATRVEIGGNAFLTAYWMGRFHNFITDEEAKRKFWEEGLRDCLQIRVAASDALEVVAEFARIPTFLDLRSEVFRLPLPV
jgi:hypothetical protein